MQIVFLGPPGVGKGTQAKTVAQEQGVPHISSGDMLREAIHLETPTGRKAKTCVESGRLAPDDVMIDLIAERMARPDCAKGFVLDGFPRTLAQAEALDAMLKDKRRPLNAVLYFDADEATIVERLSGRRLCKTCGAGYHVKFMPSARQDICDKCGGPLYQRADDKAETIRERLQVYNRQTAALIEYYRKLDVLTPIAGAKAVDQVEQQVRSALAAVAAQKGRAKGTDG